MFQFCLKVVAGCTVTDQPQGMSLVQGTVQGFCKVEEDVKAAAQNARMQLPPSLGAVVTVQFSSVFVSLCNFQIIYPLTKN